MAPGAQPLGNFIQVRQRAVGYRGHEVEAVVFGCADPVVVDGQKRPASCSREALFAVEQCGIACQDCSWGGLDMYIGVRVLDRASTHGDGRKLIGEDCPGADTRSRVLETLETSRASVFVLHANME